MGASEIRISGAPLKVILDTDMGPDCDDAGALGLFHTLARRVGAGLIAATHCTSMPWGCGCIDAINRAYGQPDIPIGTLKESGFLNAPEYQKYNRHVAENYENRFMGGAEQPDARQVIRRALEDQPDGGVTFISIGPLTNLAALLTQPDLAALVARKVGRTVSMAGRFTFDGKPEPGWNVAMDICAARRVAGCWPGPIDFVPFEAGADIITGRSWGAMPPEHPVRRAYELYSPQGRSSWDLLAVYYALMGAEPYFDVSAAGQVTIDEDGISRFDEAAGGRMRIVMPRQGQDIAGAIDALWEA